MKYPKKYDPYDDLPGDIRSLITQIAKRFRSPGLNYQLVKKFLHEEIMREALVGADQNIAKAAKNLGVEYITLWMNVRRRQEKLKREMNVGENDHDGKSL